MNLIVFFCVILILTAIVSLGLAAFGYKHRSASGARALSILMIAVAEWCVCSAAEWLTPSLPAKLLFANLSYLGIGTLPAAMMILALQYSRPGYSPRWFTCFLLGVEPVAVLILALTNQSHHLLRTSATLISVDGLQALDVKLGPAFWGHTVYSYVLLACSVVLLFRQIWHSSSSQFIGQVLSMLIGILAPWVGNVLYLVGLNPVPYFDFTPVGFMITGIALYYGIFRFHLLDLVPVARDIVLESMKDAVIVLNLQNRIVDANRAALTLFDLSREQIFGGKASSILPAPFAPKDEHPPADEASEIKWNQCYYRISNSPVCANGQSRVGTLILLQDITERKQTERMKDEFVSVVSHELRTPVTSIRASLGLLAGEVVGVLPEQMKSLVAISLEDTERLSRLLDDILDMERIQEGKMEFRHQTLDLVDLARRSLDGIRCYAKQFGVQFQLEASVSNALVHADSDRMMQVMTNLLSNAAKFSPQNGEIKIMIERKEGAFRVSVADHGPGIPENFRSRIFQPFAQADSSDSRGRGGTGLGLSICKAIIEKHGGQLGFQSEAGAGSTFFFDLNSVS